MTRLNWNDPSARRADLGLDRGVLYPKTKPAVPWIGLTGVDENGAESSKTYYLNGRPYLIVPQPKEYAGTIKAYTYPDEFSELMGFPEVADGMYADSQQGDVFDLSYRTLVANQSEGIDYGYKIHLVYNVVVAPQSLSYDTMGDSISPVDFAWDIQAVPVPLDGHRATAHVVIDTRHLDKTIIAEVEDLLYGTDSTTVSALPDPNQIFDMLSFGNMVVVTDNGDGTWTAVGPYDSIQISPDGNFVIKNVEANMGPDDGEYTFGELPPPPEEPTELDGGTPTSIGTSDYDGGDSEDASEFVYDGGTP